MINASTATNRLIVDIPPTFHTGVHAKHFLEQRVIKGGTSTGEILGRRTACAIRSITNGGSSSTSTSTSTSSKNQTQTKQGHSSHPPLHPPLPLSRLSP